MSKCKIKKALILAAGFGTRLKPLTDNLPKALIPYKGRPMIENVISKLTSYGINEIVINTHHHADRMEDYFSSRSGNEKITLIHEAEILGTGGALKNAERELIGSENFLVYNTDVDCEVNLEEFIKFHQENAGIATLCVQERETSRYLICDIAGKLIGRTENGQKVFYSEISKEYRLMAFCGIHMLNDEIFGYFPENESNFDIIPIYMSLIKNNKPINYFDISSVNWKDLGTPQNL